MFVLKHGIKIAPLMDLHTPGKWWRVKLKLGALWCLVIGHKRILWGHEFNYTTSDIDTKFLCCRCRRVI